MIAGGGTEGVQAIQQTPEELQQICVHVWRDESETSEKIVQKCIRCQKVRNISLL